METFALIVIMHIMLTRGVCSIFAKLRSCWPLTCFNMLRCLYKCIFLTFSFLTRGTIVYPPWYNTLKKILYRNNITATHFFFQGALNLRCVEFTMKQLICVCPKWRIKKLINLPQGNRLLVCICLKLPQIIAPWQGTLVSRALFLLWSCNLSQFLFQRDNVNLDENLVRVLNFYYCPIICLLYFSCLIFWFSMSCRNVASYIGKMMFFWDTLTEFTCRPDSTFLSLWLCCWEVPGDF